VIDPRYFRPAEVDDLRADASKARQMLNWQPEVDFQQLVALMVDADVADLQLRIAGGAKAIRTSVGPG
jgi:GDP-D-mannose dehydratase